MNFSWIVNLVRPVVVFVWLVRGEVASAIKAAFDKKEPPPPAPSYERGKLASAKRSSLPGSFTTLHSLLKIMVERVLVS